MNAQQPDWASQRVKVLQQMFPRLDQSDEKVQKASEYLDECVQFNDILDDRFYGYFPHVPRAAIKKAIADGQSVMEVIIRCADLRDRETLQRGLSQEARSARTISKADGHKYKGGPGVHAS